MWNSSDLRDHSFISKSPNPSRSHMSAKTTRGVIPTAKVPSYLNRVRRGFRDTRPGLLPTPDLPPMRPGQLSLHQGCDDGSMSSRSGGREGSPIFEDVYATPYAVPQKMNEVHRAGSVTSNSNSVKSDCITSTPSSTCSKIDQLHGVNNSSQQNNRERFNDDDIVNSLLNLLIGSDFTQEQVNVDLMESIAGFYSPSINDTQ